MPIWAILNADDFGLSPGINRGIIETHREGILTSASLMVVGAAFEEAAALAHENPGLSLGVHLTLVEGSPILPPDKVPSLVTSDGCFLQSLGLFLTKWLQARIRLEDVRREFEAQIKKVLDYRVRIDKLDSHMHLHLLPGIFGTVLTLARQYRIPAVRLPKERMLGWNNSHGLAGLCRRAILSSIATLRHRQIARSGLFTPDHFSGIAESGRLTEDDLLSILRRLDSGITEVMLHPGHRDGTLDAWPMSRRYEREQELMALTSPQVKALVHERQIGLMSYREVVEGRMVWPRRTEDAQG